MSTDAKFPVLLNVNISETDNHCDIKADITGFHARNVNVTPWEDSLVVEMQGDDVPGQSYYLGEVEPECFRRIIPLGFQVNDGKVITHYQDGKLNINVAKQISDATRFA
ncbi:MAG: Hsp20 family protein [Granulosicoccus sp.]